MEMEPSQEFGMTGCGYLLSLLYMKFRIDKRRMLPHQVAFWELPNFVKLLVGGYGCGKMHIGAFGSIYDSFVNAPAPHLYVSP